jgi:hypothetical protein
MFLGELAGATHRCFTELQDAGIEHETDKTADYSLGRRPGR